MINVGSGLTALADLLDWIGLDLGTTFSQDAAAEIVLKLDIVDRRLRVRIEVTVLAGREPHLTSAKCQHRRDHELQ